MPALRPEHRIIADWITAGSRILDLGCGDGTLLAHLRDNRQVSGYGLEIDQAKIVQAIAKDVNVIQTDLNAGLTEFESNSFDYVVMSQTLQAVNYPDRLLEEMLRVGREGIITFPNFGHWSCRLQLLMGHMPVTPSLPNTWYNTPNIHLCTLRDFEALCADKAFHILERTVVDRAHRTSLPMRLLPNLMGEVALYRFQRR
jgi:methionine biosynthesis protein MetW